MSTLQILLYIYLSCALFNFICCMVGIIYTAQDRKIDILDYVILLIYTAASLLATIDIAHDWWVMKIWHDIANIIKVKIIKIIRKIGGSIDQ